MPRGETPRSGRPPAFDGKTNVLPREGRQAPAPAWPIPGQQNDREAQLWEQEWRRPQALIWERDDLVNDVALYVRKRAEAELPGSSSASVDTMRRLADDLLLTIPAMRRAGVAIAAAPAETPARSGGSAAPRSTGRAASGHRRARDRFTVVSPGDAASDLPREDFSA